MIEDIKIYLGDAAENFTNAQIDLCLRTAKAEVEAYCGRELDTELELIAAQIAVIKLNRLNTEGLTGQSFSGANENYLDGYPSNILAALNRKRKLRVI